MTAFQRIFYSFILSLIPNPKSRTEFMRKHHLFGSLGTNCNIQRKKLPLYSNLVHIHNNVRLASEVIFVTHDGIHKMLNEAFSTMDFVERVGCIEIMDNVFIGSGTRILYNTRIGSNVIIGSDSLVNKDIPDNSVYAGVPVRYICSFEEYVQKAKMYSDGFVKEYGTRDVIVSHDLAQQMYRDFCERRLKCE